MMDVVWQVTGLASLVTFSVVGLVLRRQVARLDERRTHRHRQARS